MLKPVTILLTCCLGDYMKGTVDCFRNNEDNRPVNIVGVDVKPYDEFDVKDFVGVERYHQVPYCDDENYIVCLFSICQKEKVDVLIPCNTKELLRLSSCLDKFESIGTTVLLSPLQGLKIANDKVKTFVHMKKNGYPVPTQIFTADPKIVRLLMEKHPKKFFCVKEKDNCGGRGFARIDNGNDIDFHFKDGVKKIVQEYLTGDEYTVDLLMDHGNCIVGIAKQNLQMTNGVAQSSVVVDKPELIELCKNFAESLSLHGCIGFDLKYSKEGIVYIIDCNPRMTATISLCKQAGVNMPYYALKQALNEPYNKTFKIKLKTSIKRKICDHFFDEGGNLIA